MAYHIRYYTFVWILFCHFCDGKNKFTNFINKNEEAEIFRPLTISTRDFFKDVFFYKPEESTCYRDITNITIIRNLFEYSGEDISDLGNEIECEHLNLSYYIFIYTFANFTSDSEEFNNTEKNEIFNLVGNDSYFYTGVCLPPSCNEILSNISINNRTINNSSNLFYYLNESMKIKEIQYVSKNTKLKKQFSPMNASFLIVAIILLIYFIFQCLSTLILEFFLKGSNEKKEVDNSLANTDKNDEKKKGKSKKRRTITKKLISVENKNNIDLLFNSTYYNSSLYIQAEFQNKSTFYKIINFLSFTSSISKLSDTKNNIYNEKHLKMLSLIKTILLFFIIYNHNFFTQHKYPGRGFFNVDFYSSYFFSTVKFTTFSSDCFIALEAFTMIYKLMNYMKTHYFEKGEKLHWVLFKFWLLFIPKMILFFANFYILHYFVPHFSSLFNIGAFQQYYLRTIAHKKQCEANQYQLFIPFYLSYCADEGKALLTFSTCFRFVYTYLNMFYIFTLFLIIFYGMYKIKSKIMDKIIALLVALGTILTFLSFYIVDQTDVEKYDLYKILGQGITIKFPHLFINTYMFGVFTGLIYFYFLDVISNRPITSENTYIPFSFCFEIMKFFDSLSMLIKILIIIITIILQIILSMTYNFYRSYYQEGENTILAFPVTTFMKIFDQYDKQIFTLIFLIMTIFFMLISKESVLRNLTSFSIFTFISRTSFSIFSSMDYIIYIIYMVLNIQNSLTYKNLVFNSIGEFVIIMIICGLVTTIFELPFRTLLKYLLGKDDSGDISNQLDNSLLTTSKLEDD